MNNEKCMKILLYHAVSWIGLIACQRKMSAEVISQASGIPACIQKKIDSIKQQPVWNPPAEVYEYTYQERTVFLFSADCCDRPSMAVDQNCNYVCAPSGGFTGKGDRKCLDFFEKAKMVRSVWKDERKRSR